MASDTLTATQKGRSVEAMSAPVLTANVEENSERINKGFNSTHEYCPEVELIDIDQIEKDPEAADIFERNPTVFESIRDRMEREGFHDYNPAKVWDLGNGRYVPYDGNSRIDVAKELGLKSIPVVKTIFNSRAEFIQAAINEQIDRRNLSVKDKFMVVRYCHPLEAEKARKRHGGQSADKSADSPKGRADTVLGKKIGYGPDTVARIRALIDEDDKDLLESVFTGEISIGGAYEVLKVNKLEDTPKSKKLTEDDSGDGDEVEDESSDETPQENTPVYKGRESDSPRVPIKFLQSVAVLIDINHGEDLLNILGDSYAEAGSIFGEALKGRKS
jgi:ParB-like chromosome segregation protein Spo0J